MGPVKKANGTTVQYVIEPLARYQVKRIVSNEDASIEEDILQAADILEARLAARSLTEYERANPQDAYAKVLSFGDVEIH